MSLASNTNETDYYSETLQDLSQLAKGISLLCFLPGQWLELHEEDCRFSPLQSFPP